MEIQLNGEALYVDNPDGNLSLLEWMRNKAHVKSAKQACGEGGCGACAVLVTDVDPATGEATGVRSVNSCLTPVYAVNGCKVLTAEGLPKNAEGQNPVAERLAGFHASQCGFCTPGMAVACHAAMAKAAACGRPVPSSMDMRNALDGNLCRCTGYRPIIAACKSFSPDLDMEDLGVNTFTSAGQPLPTPADLGGAYAVPSPDPPAAKAPMREFKLAAGQKLFVPNNLQQLIEVVSRHSTGSMRLVAGSTGHGVYKDWPTQDVLVHIMHVHELRQLSVSPETRVRSQRAVRIGAAVTLASVIQQLRTWEQATPTQNGSAAPEDGVTACPGVWREVAAHMERVAGSHVRNAATLVGNLVLTRRKGLPSDIATLMLAAHADLEVLDASKGPNKAQSSLVSLEDYLHRSHTGQATPDLDGAALLVTAALLPIPPAGSHFWSSRVASRWANAASVVNAAALRPGAGSTTRPTFVLGMNLNHTTSAEEWRAAHCRRVEAVLAETTAPPASLSGLALPALEALSQDLETSFGLHSDSVAAGHKEFLRSTAEGLLLQALAALYYPDTQAHITLSQNGHKADASLADAAAAAPIANGTACMLPSKLSPPHVSTGCQVLPSLDASCAPLTQALPKESALLQALGAAQFSDDVPEAQGALYAAWVTSKVAKGTVKNVDTKAAMQAPGFVRFIGRQDIPGKDPKDQDTEPVFGPQVMYHGQPVGLVLADSYQAAQRAARLVEVEVEAPETPPVLTMQQALERGALYDLTKQMPHLPPGKRQGSVVKGADDASEKVLAAPLRLLQQRLHLPSQQHLYMEPQTAVAELDEDGCMRVHLSTQATDMAMVQVAALLNVPQNKVEVKCRRAGGGFGGKVTAPPRFAAAAAVAALVTKRQVRLANNRNTDMAMIAGRCEVDVTIDVGYDQEGRVLALDMDAVLTAGGFVNLSCQDVAGMISVIDNVYQVPSFRAQFTLLRCNLPPRTAVRAPGDFPAVIVMEWVMERVAAALCMDPLIVRERNMRQPTPGGLVNSVGKPLGPAEQYSLPRMWQELKDKVDWPARVEAVQAFNKQSTWRKRGLSMTPCMYPLYYSHRTALVHVYADGSIRVAHAGVEIGQGLGIKVLQTAAYELSQVLPKSQRPLPLGLLRTADVSSYTLPHNSFTAGSTTSDAACGAVRKACSELVSRLRPIAEKLGESFTWQQLIAKTVTFPGFRPVVDLTAVADATLGSDLITPAAHPFHHMSTYGVAVAEVEVDVLTGDRQVLSVDILFDCGRSLNPAVDLGQIEGAFTFGMGLMLSEHAESDPVTGACTTASTWSYKVPGPMCVPHRLNVAMLENSPLGLKGLLSAKAVGEPPLLLSCCVLFALEAAVRSAAQQLYGDNGTALRLSIPATPASVKQACGTAPLLSVLKRLAEQGSV